MNAVQMGIERMINRIGRMINRTGRMINKIGRMINRSIGNFTP